MDSIYKQITIRLQDNAVIEITVRFNFFAGEPDEEVPVEITSVKLNGEEQW